MLRRRSTAFRGVALLALLSLAGCQTFQPATLDTLEQGSRIRVEFNEPVSVDLRDLTAQRVVALDAETVGVRDDNLVVSALWLEQESRAPMLGEAWTVSVPVGNIATVSEKKLDWIRTAGLLGGIVLATVLGWSSVGGGGGEGGNGPGQGR